MSTRPVKTRDDYALGAANKKTGRRKGGYLAMLKAQNQNQAKLAAGEITEDDLIQRAYELADEQIAKNMAGPDEEPQTFTEADQQYRDEQEARYREVYDWENANPNDEAQLQMLLDLEVQQRVVNREFSAAHMNVKDRTSLLGELRNIAKDHAELQKRLGFDRATRETKKAADDPMAEWQRVVVDGAAKFDELETEALTRFPEAKTLEELRALAKHTLMLDYNIIDCLLENHLRLMGLQSTSSVVES